MLSSFPTRVLYHLHQPHDLATVTHSRPSSLRSLCPAHSPLSINPLTTHAPLPLILPICSCFPTPHSLLHHLIIMLADLSYLLPPHHHLVVHSSCSQHHSCPPHHQVTSFGNEPVRLHRLSSHQPHGCVRDGRLQSGPVTPSSHPSIYPSFLVSRTRLSNLLRDFHFLSLAGDNYYTSYSLADFVSDTLHKFSIFALHNYPFTSN